MVGKKIYILFEDNDYEKVVPLIKELEINNKVFYDCAFIDSKVEDIEEFSNENNVDNCDLLIAINSIRDNWSKKFRESILIAINNEIKIIVIGLDNYNRNYIPRIYYTIHDFLSDDFEIKSYILLYDSKKIIKKIDSIIRKDIKKAILNEKIAKKESIKKEREHIKQLKKEAKAAKLKDKKESIKNENRLNTNISKNGLGVINVDIAVSILLIIFAGLAFLWILYYKYIGNLPAINTFNSVPYFAHPWENWGSGLWNSWVEIEVSGIFSLAWKAITAVVLGIIYLFPLIFELLWIAITHFFYGAIKIITIFASGLIFAFTYAIIPILAVALIFLISKLYEGKKHMPYEIFTMILTCGIAIASYLIAII